MRVAGAVLLFGVMAAVELALLIAAAPTPPATAWQPIYCAVWPDAGAAFFLPCTEVGPAVQQT